MPHSNSFEPLPFSPNTDSLNSDLKMENSMSGKIACWMSLCQAFFEQWITTEGREGRNLSDSSGGVRV
jgi:hypothetical protein